VEKPDIVLELKTQLDTLHSKLEVERIALCLTQAIQWSQWCRQVTGETVSRGYFSPFTNSPATSRHHWLHALTVTSSTQWLRSCVSLVVLCAV